jgi:pimeloyl-ACP methyl ester carboxylesterase
MLLSDKVSVSAFLGARSESSRKAGLLKSLKLDLRKKVFITGLEDKLFLPALAKDEAAQAGFRFYGIANSGHFPVFEAPKELSQIFKSEFLNKEEK